MSSTTNNIAKLNNLLAKANAMPTQRLQTKTLTSNGMFTPDAGYSGFSSVTVDVTLTGSNTVSPMEYSVTLTEVRAAVRATLR